MQFITIAGEIKNIHTLYIAGNLAGGFVYIKYLS